MKIFYLISILILFNSFSARSQNNAKGTPDLWDIPTTEALISHNQQNYRDNKDVKDKQLQSTATVSVLKTTKDRCKELMDSLDKRLNSLFIIVADGLLALRVSSIMKDIYEYQSESFQIVIRNPEASLLYYNNQIKIIDDAKSVTNLIAMVILSYTDIGKMKVADRKIVYTQIIKQLSYLKERCHILNILLQNVEFSDLYKKSKAWQYIDMDKKMVEDILNGWKH